MISDAFANAIFSKRYHGLRCSARRRGHIVTLTVADVRRLFDEFPNCPCCGVGFEYVRKSARKPTIDRCDSKLGYTPDNVQLLCDACNQAKQGGTSRYLPRSQWHPAAEGLWYPELIVDLLFNRKATRRLDTTPRIRRT